MIDYMTPEDRFHKDAIRQAKDIVNVWARNCVFYASFGAGVNAEKTKKYGKSYYVRIPSFSNCEYSFEWVANGRKDLALRCVANIDGYIVRGLRIGNDDILEYKTEISGKNDCFLYGEFRDSVLSSFEQWALWVPYAQKIEQEILTRFSTSNAKTQSVWKNSFDFCVGPKCKNQFIARICRKIGETSLCDECFDLCSLEVKPEKPIQHETKKEKSEREKLTSSLRWLILERDNFTCKACGKKVSDGVKMHVDHIHPISKGGKTEESNLQVLCADCNLGKSDKILSQSALDFFSA